MVGGAHPTEFSNRAFYWFPSSCLGTQLIEAPLRNQTEDDALGGTVFP